MKHITLLLTAILISVFYACDDNDDNGFYIRFDKENIKLNAIENTSATIEISSSSNWSLETELPEWLVISNLSGYESPMSITVTAKRNNNMEKREATLVFHNGDDIRRSINITQLGIADSDPFIELSETRLIVPLYESAKTIDLTTNVSWEITSIPTWIVISSTSGNESVPITITTEENEEIQGREATLTFSSKDGKTKSQLVISQPGRQDLIQSLYLPIFRGYAFSYNNNGLYNINADELFVNSAIRNKIYLGNLIENKTNNYPEFPTFTGYTFKPITVSTASPVYLTIKTFTPSLQEQETLAKEVIVNHPNKNANITYDYFSPTGYQTHRILYSIGWANLGIELDKIMSGVSYKEQEMTKKRGMIFSFKHTLFNLQMDLQEKLINEDLKDTDKAKEISYISSMEYGKVGLLIVESDDKYNQIKDAISRILRNEEDNIYQTQDNTLIEAADIAYVYFNNKSEVQVNKNKKEAIKAYRAALYNKKDKENIYPISFMLTNFKNHSMDEIVFSFDTGK